MATRQKYQLVPYSLIKKTIAEWERGSANICCGSFKSPSLISNRISQAFPPLWWASWNHLSTSKRTLWQSPLKWVSTYTNIGKTGLPVVEYHSWKDDHWCFLFSFYISRIVVCKLKTHKLIALWKHYLSFKIVHIFFFRTYGQKLQNWAQSNQKN